VGHVKIELKEGRLKRTKVVKFKEYKNGDWKGVMRTVMCAHK
jgi:hypothetical protein